MLPHPPPVRRLSLLTLAVFLLPFPVRPLAAQRAPAEYRTQAISVFGSFLYSNLGYSYSPTGVTPGYASGGALGFDVTRFFLRVPLAVSLEARANVTFGTQGNEHTYIFGPRVAYGFGRYHPYGEFEVGLGNIHFNPVLQETYYGDKSAIAAGGGGVDVDLLRNVQARVDFQVQQWDIDPLHHQTFVPTLLTVGVNYTIPFRPFHRQGDPHY